MLFAYAAIGALAVLPIYTGAHAALRRPATAPKAITQEELEEDEFFAGLETLSKTEAMMFPFLGGAMLGSMYLVITYVSQEWLSYLFNLYFTIIGVGANTQMFCKLGPYIRPSLISLPTYKLKIHKKRSEEKEDSLDKSEVFSVAVSALHVLSCVLAVALSAYYSFTKNWIASNIFGLSFSFAGIQLMALDSFLTGMILLSGLFIYDIYFVFGTEIMVTVAKGLKAPIMIMFPKDILHDPNGPATMLGLGDIVIPGIYIALCLRFDLSEHHRTHPNATYRKGFFRFEKPYFSAAIVAYIIGLSTTIFVMHAFQAAQPALLYLSPACIGSTLITACYRHELKDLWTYRDHRHAVEAQQPSGQTVDCKQD